MTRSVQRFDFGRLRTNGAGGARVPATIARTGIQIYHDADGREIREYRPPEEVFADESLASLASVPVTVGHHGTVDARNWKSVSVGHVSEAPPGRQTVDGAEWVEATAVVSDGDTLARVQSGDLAEVSMGYVAELDETPGVAPNGERYDAIQRGIRFNHLALLPKGRARAGAGARLRLDSRGNQEMAVRQDAGDAPKRVVKVDGVEYEHGSDSHVSALENVASKAQARVDAAEKAAEDAGKQAGEAKAKLDAAEKRVAELEARDVGALVQDELNFRDSVKSALPANYDFAGKSRDAVQRDVVGPEVSAKIDSLPENQRAGYLACAVDNAVKAAAEAPLPPLHKADAAPSKKAPKKSKYDEAFEASFKAAEVAEVK